MKDAENHFKLCMDSIRNEKLNFLSVVRQFFVCLKGHVTEERKRFPSAKNAT